MSTLAGGKRWLPLLRDSIAFKVAYAYGLRRRELTMLELHDFGPNPHVADYGRFGAVIVRWAKGTAGSGPRRRTVLTVPEFEWVVPLLQFWTGPWTGPAGRDRFATAERSGSLWPSERGDRVRLGSLGDAFAQARDAVGLSEGVGSALSAPLLRHPPDRSRLRPGVRADPARALPCLDHRPLHLGVGGLQAAHRAADDRPPPRHGDGDGRWLSSGGSVTAGTCAR